MIVTLNLNGCHKISHLVKLTVGVGTLNFMPSLELEPSISRLEVDTLPLRRVPKHVPKRCLLSKLNAVFRFLSTRTQMENTPPTSDVKFPCFYFQKKKTPCIALWRKICCARVIGFLWP
uniref:Uncharacterized protein n=1 Tax=Cacopsylla melanoneura TaxID=428564 RepID=A0A8D9BTM9_9HEMI